MSNIEGKSAIVTGATRGIGLAVARALLDCGATVFICSRSTDDVERVVDSLQQDYGNRIQGAACDVRNYDQVSSMFARVKQALSGLDILINNAGIGSHSYVEGMSVEEWDSTIQTNLSGVFYCCHEALPLMKQRGGGYMINIGSLAGKNAFPGGAAYCASKFAIVGFSEALMQEVRYDHIRVSYLMPGSVNTSFGRSGEQDAATSWKLAPADVATAVVSLLEMDSRALASRVELRPSEPQK
jgi:3-oxoacyl-[acyl-carrier protein] reductase